MPDLLMEGHTCSTTFTLIISIQNFGVFIGNWNYFISKLCRGQLFFSFSLQSCDLLATQISHTTMNRIVQIGQIAIIPASVLGMNYWLAVVAAEYQSLFENQKQHSFALHH